MLFGSQKAKHAAIDHLLAAKSRVKKFWSKGKTSGKLSSDNKPLSLSQPNLAALDRDAEVKPITMYEMSVGHSIDGNNIANHCPLPFVLLLITACHQINNCLTFSS